MDSESLVLVREVDRRGSLTRAAASLHVTQSALSHAVRRIEERLGTPVWKREGRTLRLTPAGEYLLGLANRLLPQLEHADAVIAQYAGGGRGMLRIGMECHPCYRWLLRVVAPYLRAWPDVDVDVRQRFQFGGIGALFGHEIDVLVTPDPVRREGLRYVPVLDYEQVLVVPAGHRLARAKHATAADLAEETLITYPVAIERLDVFSQFLIPARRLPRRHKVIEDTDVMLQMVASGRGVTALPRWLVDEYRPSLGLVPVRLGPRGILKQIFLGLREGDARVDYVAAFVELAAAAQRSGSIARATKASTIEGTTFTRGPKGSRQSSGAKKVAARR